MGYSIKQHDTLASKTLWKINAKLKLHYHKSIYLIPAFRRTFCNALIQWYFDCGCFSLFSLLKKKLNIKLQKAQKKCIRFCLNLSLRSRIDPSYFRKMKLCPAQNTILCIPSLSTRMELYQDIHDMFKPSFLKYSIKSLMPLDIRLWKTNAREKRLYFFRPKVNTFAYI